MFRNIALALFVLMAMPASDGMAQDKSKAGKKAGVNCDAVARANCPTYGQSGLACYRSALARCRQGKK